MIIVMVYFCVNLICLRDAQTEGRILFLIVSLRLPLEEISIWIRLSDEDRSHQCGCSSSACLRAPNRTKRHRKGEFIPSAWAETSTFPDPGCVFLVLRTSESAWSTPRTFLGLYLVEGRLWDFSTSVIKWAEFCFCCFSFSGGPITTMDL